MSKKLGLTLAALLVSIYSYSQWNPFDYSIYKTASQYIDDYPTQEDTSLYAEFSWDKVPRWLAIRSGNVFSQADINTIANNHQMVMLEKYNSQGTSSTEKGTLAAAARLKAVNPDIKILFYWNTWINYWGYDANAEYEINKWDWSNLTQGANGEDTIYMFKDKYYTYNYDIPGLRNWWVKTAQDMVLEDVIDGVFIDKVHSYEGLFFQDGEPSNNYIRMLDSLSQLLPEGKIFFGNTLRNERWGGSRGHMNYSDGSYWERWEYIYRTTSPAQSQADARCVNMQLAREAVLKGKIVNFMGGGETTAVPPSEAEENEANMRGFLREDVQFPLGVFLIIADTNAYFNYKESVTTDDEDWKWDRSFLEEFNRPLGKPLNDPVKNGYEYTRSYEKLDVWVNVQTTEAKLSWKDYPDFLKLKLVVRDSVSLAGIAGARIEVEDLSRITDGGGSLRFGLDSGSYVITISKPGYLTKTETYNFASNSTHNIELAPRSADGPDDEISGYYQISKSNAPGFCIYAGEDDLMKEGDQLSLFTYIKDDPGTVWGEFDRGDGYYSYQKLNTNFCIDGGVGGENNQEVFISECDKENYNQHWQKEELSSGYLRLKKHDADFVLNGGSGGAIGQDVNLWKSSVTSGNLEWKFNAVFEAPVSLTILVVDSISNQALSGVDITLNDETKQTEANGEAIFSNLEVPNTLAYVLSRDGYISKQGMLGITKDDTISISMAPVPETSTLTVHVVDSITNQALSGVEVTLDNNTKLTEANGEAIFSNLEVPNTLDYMLSRDGYISKDGSLEITSDTTLTIALVALSSGIREDMEAGVNIYPNPASDYLMIEANKEIARVKIFSIDGQLILSQRVVSNMTKIELAGETQALLFVKLVFEDGFEIIKKVIINPVDFH